MGHLNHSYASLPEAATVFCGPPLQHAWWCPHRPRGHQNPHFYLLLHKYYAYKHVSLCPSLTHAYIYNQYVEYCRVRTYRISIHDQHLEWSSHLQQDFLDGVGYENPEENRIVFCEAGSTLQRRVFTENMHTITSLSDLEWSKTWFRYI